MDETGISNEQNSSKIVASKVAKEIKKLITGEGDKSLTVISATNAVRTYVSPIFIYPRKRTVDDLIKRYRMEQLVIAPKVVA